MAPMGYYSCTCISMQSKKIQEKLVLMAKQLKTTLSYRQQAPIEKKKTTGKGPAELDGTDLFSHFTANIMKEEVMFTR
jgi:hypothetical protein